MTAREIFAYRLRNIRTMNNHSQEYVSRIIGVTQATVFYLENNTYKTTYKPLGEIINALVEHYRWVDKKTGIHYGIDRSYFTQEPVKDVRDLLMNPYLDYWVWSGQMTYEKARELEKTLPKII